MFWNVRGLGTVHRRSYVKAHILQEDLDIVALQETIKQGFSDKELKEMSGVHDFHWIWSPAKGHSGGLILGYKTELFELEQEEFSGYFIGVLLRNRVTNFRFWVVNVYGPANHEFSQKFLSCDKETLPMILGGF